MVIKLNNKKYIALLISSIVIVVVATITITYAYLSFNSTQTGTNTISASCYNIEFEDEASINLTSYPMSSETAFRTITPYKFTLSNRGCAIGNDYQIILNIKNTTSDTLLSYINYSFDATSTNKLSNLTPTTLPAGVTSSNTKASYVIDTGNIPNDTSKSFELYLWIDESAGNDIMGLTFEAEVMVYNTAGAPEEVPPSSKDYIIATSKMGEGTPNFAHTSCSSGCNEATVGLYEETTSKGTTYYFRGDVEDNYLEFAGFYWRIIRINEDGSIRLIYSGNKEEIDAAGKETVLANGYDDSSTKYTQIGTSGFNDSRYGNEYAGYTYSIGYQRPSDNPNGETDSTIKEVLDNWYSTNIGNNNDYDSKVVSSPGFCNDREVANGYTWSSTGGVYYAAYERLFNGTISLECSNSNDLYITKIGLITADEVWYAGASSGFDNYKYYLYTGNDYSTMSPYQYHSLTGLFILKVSTLGLVDRNAANSSIGVRPVINISSDVTITGSGTISDPYVVS